MYRVVGSTDDGGGGRWGISAPSPQFCCEPRAALKCNACLLRTLCFSKESSYNWKGIESWQRKNSNWHNKNTGWSFKIRGEKRNQRTNIKEGEKQSSSRWKSVPFRMFLSSLPSEVWSVGRLGQHHLGAGSECRISGPTPLTQNLRLNKKIPRPLH